MHIAANARMGVIAGGFIALAQSLPAHVIWTRANDIDPFCRALYHFTSASTTAGSHILPASPEPSSEELVVSAPTAGAGASLSTDTGFSFLGPNSLKLIGTQTIATQGNVLGGNLGQAYQPSNDCSLEFWMKWDAASPQQTIRAGLASTASILVIRDTTTPSNDRFGIEFSNGDYVSAPGFTNWNDVDPDEAALDEWHHFGFAIHSTGLVFNTPLFHDVYNTGSTAMMWLNDDPEGLSPFTTSIAGLRTNNTSGARIQTAGTTAVYIDELTIWSKDLSINGTVLNPFADGRGTGSSPVKDWAVY